jgi:hypothetical protein
MMDNMLHPGEDGVAYGRLAELPAFIVAQAVAAPVGDVEGWVGEDEVGFEIGMAIVIKVSPWAIWPSMPRNARFIFARRQVV